MSDEETSALDGLKQLQPNICVFRRPSTRDYPRLVRGIVFDPPGSAAKYWHKAAGEVIRDTIRSYRPDLVEFHHLNTSIYRVFAGSLPAILREHNVEYKVWERHAANASDWGERAYARWCAPRVRRYEGQAATRFDKCIVVSEADQAHLQEVSPQARIEVIPSGVDTEYFYPDSQIPEEPWSLTLTGSFIWGPKQQGLHSLLTQVFPKIKAEVPEAKLHVVGKGVPGYLRQIADTTPGVTVHGQVPDVRPYVARSALILQYLESGGGIALKVLEAMAMKKPVLSNTLGCEGIPLKHGRDVFLADGPEAFAEAAAMLLNNSVLRQRLAEEGHRRVLEKFSWYVVADRFNDCYRDLLEEREGVDRARNACRVLN
jgi:glycosyltransferase involved in cell wall biosynthesis